MIALSVARLSVTAIESESDCLLDASVLRLSVTAMESDSV